MAKFTKNTKEKSITLESNGTIKDGLKVAEWARKLINMCEGNAKETEQAFILSASHRADYAPNSVKIVFSDYYFSGINEWVKLCKRWEVIY